MSPSRPIRLTLFVFILLSIFSCGKKDSPPPPDRSPISTDKTWTGTYLVGTISIPHPQSIRFRADHTFTWHDATVSAFKGKWSVNRDTVILKLDDYNNTIRADITKDNELINFRSSAAFGYKVLSLSLNENAERSLANTVWGGENKTAPFFQIIGAGRMQWLNLDKEPGTYFWEDGLLRLNRTAIINGNRYEFKYCFALLSNGKLYGVAGLKLDHTEGPLTTTLYEH